MTGSIQHLRAEIANIDISAYRLADQRLAELFAGTGIDYISSVDALCDEETCDFLYEDSQPLYTDNWHFTPDGGRFFIDRILPELPIAPSPNERK